MVVRNGGDDDEIKIVTIDNDGGKLIEMVIYGDSV